MSNKKYLVTGGSGFIGSHLVEALRKQGKIVHNLDNFHDFYDYKIKIRNTLESIGSSEPFAYKNQKDTDLERLVEICNQTPNYKLWVKDIRDYDFLSKYLSDFQPDVIIHLAALAGVRPSIENPLEYQDVNIKGSMVLWEMCKKFGIQKFVCASSSSVYGNNEKIPFSEEDAVDHAISPYAATKKSAEVLGHVYHKLSEIDMIQLRFFTVYGPRQRPDLAIHKFTNLMKNGKAIPFFGDGNTARDYTYIDDILDGILKSIEYLEQNSGVYEILNLGECETITLNQMVEMLEKSLKTKAIKNLLPKQEGDVERTNADIKKAKEMIGYEPKTSFELGVKKFVDWYNQLQEKIV